MEITRSYSKVSKIMEQPLHNFAYLEHGVIYFKGKIFLGYFQWGCKQKFWGGDPLENTYTKSLCTVRGGARLVIF